MWLEQYNYQKGDWKESGKVTKGVFDFYFESSFLISKMQLHKVAYTKDQGWCEAQSRVRIQKMLSKKKIDNEKISPNCFILQFPKFNWICMRNW